jgi:signal transduction histidine kinase
MRPQNSSGQNNGRTESQSTHESEAILCLVETIFGELSQPMTVVLGLSDLLLAKVDQDDPLAGDLTTLLRQANRISEIAEGINYVIRY